MARVEAQTVWTVTDECGSSATVEISNVSDEGPRLEIEQGSDKIWLDAEAAPHLIAALQAAIEGQKK